MDLSLFDYDLPADRIAQVPLPRRDASRMIVLREGRIEDRLFEDLPSLLGADDLVVLNESRVFPARLRDGNREILFLRPVGDGPRWEALCRPARRFSPGRTLTMRGITVAVERTVEGVGKRVLRIPEGLDLMVELERLGEPPLPPYILRDDDPLMRRMDLERYQAIFAANTGSAAAPTAGLHFTEGMLARIRSTCRIAHLTLHVSNATFQPIRTRRIEEHRLEPEEYVIGEDVVREIERARIRNGRVVAVGTTVVRALESAAAVGALEHGPGSASAYITPGYRFRVVDALLTNFHQPRSSLLVLVSAFAGIDSIRAAYGHALGAGYRFLSYGDCMFVCRADSRDLPAAHRDMSREV
ncbi:MAG: tRNA preQ1(34) S-adenosylmethionine ribosyltransferase-isomerase QueA [Acidobacteriota bacterium]